MPPAPPTSTHAERLARLEVQLDHLILLAAHLQADLREHLELQRATQQRHQERLEALDRRVDRLQTHLAWLKGLWAAAQATVFGWIGLK